MLHPFGKHAACESFLRFGVAPGAKTIIDGSLHDTHGWWLAGRARSYWASVSDRRLYPAKHRLLSAAEPLTLRVQPRVNIPVRHLHTSTLSSQMGPQSPIQRW